MNVRTLVKTVCTVFIILAIFMLIPLFIALYCGEEAAGGFALSAAVTGGIGLCGFAIRAGNPLKARDGLVIVALCWIGVVFAGALPFLLTGVSHNYFDCLFESVSGFTTTGSTIFTVVEDLPMSILMWRSLMHWIGGMGVIVFMLFVVSKQNAKSIYLMNAESTGPVKSKLLPDARQTAIALYCMYAVLTLAEILTLLLAGLSPFDAVIHAFSTAGTGGFSTSNASVGAYSSQVQIIITIYMLIFSISFSLYFLMLQKKFREVLHSTELRVYIIVLVSVISIIVIDLMCTGTYTDIGDAVRDSAFQSVSVSSTTGFSTVDFDTWPMLAKVALFFLMFAGSMSGSTGGGAKYSRIIIASRANAREMRKLTHPNLVETVKLNGKPVAEETVHLVKTFLLLYFVIIAIGTLIVALDNFDFMTSFSSVLTSISNVGPGFSLAGPASNYSMFSDLSKVTLSACMLLGRLEIFPILLIFSRRTWRT